MTRQLRHSARQHLDFAVETHVDGASFVFTVALGLACGLIFGLAPALQLARLDPQSTLRAGASTPPRSRLRKALLKVGSRKDVGKAASVKSGAISPGGRIVFGRVGSIA